MSVVGAYEDWIKDCEKQRKINIESIKNNDARTIEELRHYAAHGETIQKPQRTIESMPPSKSWERFLPAVLKMYGNYRALEMQETGLSSSPWPIELAQRSFASIYTSEMITVMTHILFPIRFGGRALQTMDMKLVPFAALGLLIGAAEPASALAKMQLAAYRQGYYLAKGHYPIFTFMLRIFGDYLGESPLAIEGESAVEPIFNSLYERWRLKDSSALKDSCLAACDYHISRCSPSKRDQFHEFDNGSWMRVPIEILLLFKLRQLIGLDNPQLDHPLMSTEFGRLPPESEFWPDELIAGVRSRMVLDGFDESAIRDLAGAKLDK